MGLFDLLKPNKTDQATARSALDEARDPGSDPNAITDLLQRILAIGVDGIGPLEGAERRAERLLRQRGETEQAVDAAARLGIRNAAAGGFVTSLGGFVTLPVAIPVNVFEFYTYATRMVGTIAKLRGYDVDDPQIRTAILLTLVGSRSTDILAKAGVSTASTTLGSLGLGELPKPVLMLVNKAVGFQILKGVGERVLTRFGKAIPLLGGVLGAVLDGAMMTTIAKQARREFPRLAA